MAITQTLTRVTWTNTPTSDDDVGANSAVSSDVITLAASCVAAQIQLKADNSSATPAADDYINFYVLQSSGDVDVEPDSADDYDTVNHAIFLARLDTSVEDPALVTVPFPLPQKNFKIYAQGDHADTTTNTITVSAQVIEQRAS